MRGAKIVAGLVMLALIPAAPPANQTRTNGLPDSPAPAEEMIKRFLQASGGSELAKIGTETRKGTLVRGASGPVPFETRATASGKWRYNQVFAYGDRVSYGFDGARAWIQDTEGVSAMPPREQIELALLLDVRAPLKLERLFPKLRVKGPETIGGKGAVVLSAETDEGFGIELAFDSTNGLLCRAGDLFFEDYRDVGKTKRPFLISFVKDKGRDPLRLRMQVSEIRQDVEVDESIFSKPACGLRPVEPLLYKLRNEAPVAPESLKACVGVYQADADPSVFYTVTTQGSHLMIERTGWGTRLEIRPESETSYFMRFLNREFHFVKDAEGRVTGLELGADRAQKARKIQ